MVDETIAYTETKSRFWRRRSRSLEPAPAIASAPTGADASAFHARRAATAMLIAFAVFALFDSRGIRAFARDLPGNAFTDRLVATADGWHALMERVGPAALGPAVRDRFESLREVQW